MQRVLSINAQVSTLRSTTVEFEGAKHEIRHLQEEVEVLNSQVKNYSDIPNTSFGLFY